jgi:hypothetical protein
MVVVELYSFLSYNVNIHETIHLHLGHYTNIKNDALAFTRATMLVHIISEDESSQKEEARGAAGWAHHQGHGPTPGRAALW